MTKLQAGRGGRCGDALPTPTADAAQAGHSPWRQRRRYGPTETTIFTKAICFPCLTLMGSTVIKTSTVDRGTSWEFTLCFIYLCGNRRKRKKRNKDECEKEGTSVMPWRRSFPFPSPRVPKKAASEFHFGTSARRFELKHAARRRGRQVANFCNRLLHCKTVACLLDAAQAVICVRRAGIPP